MTQNLPGDEHEPLTGGSEQGDLPSESPEDHSAEGRFESALEAGAAPEAAAQAQADGAETAQQHMPATEGLYEGSVGEGASWGSSAAEGEGETAPELSSEPTPVPADAPGNVPPEPDTDAPSTLAAPAAEAAAQPFKRGELVEGTITEASATQVRVNLSDKAEGIIPTAEIEKLPRPVFDTLQPGAVMKFYVVNPGNATKAVVLSLNRAQEELDWQRAEAMQKSQESLESQIAGYNKGGLIVRFGRLRGFVPQSQMSQERRRQIDPNVENSWSAQVNLPITVKVMEVDRSRNRLILSERSTSRETREQRKAGLISQLTVGEERVGRVVSLEDFGAFVDIGGAEGLVHLTEISWQHVTHPRDVLKPGEEVRVRVISVDPNAKRIGLSMKQMEGDPWERVLSGFTEGQLVKAQVTKLTKFGAFAQLVDLPEIEGLIHISELSDKRVLHPREVVNEGDVLTLRVVRIEAKDRRLALSLKRVTSSEYLDIDWAGGAME